MLYCAGNLRNWRSEFLDMAAYLDGVPRLFAGSIVSGSYRKRLRHFGCGSQSSCASKCRDSLFRLDWFSACYFIKNLPPIDAYGYS